MTAEDPGAEIVLGAEIGLGVEIGPKMQGQMDRAVGRPGERGTACPCVECHCEARRLSAPGLSDSALDTPAQP